MPDNPDLTPTNEPTRIVKAVYEVKPRILGMGLTLPGLVRIARVSRNAAGNGMTPFHARNAPGTFGYHYGVFAMRDEFVPTGNWEIECVEGIECIFSKEQNIRIAFCNVDVCCNDFYEPVPKSEKGEGAARVCQDNLFGTLPHFTKPEMISGTPMFYVLVDDEGRCELSQPVIANKTFKSYVERIYISIDGGDDLDGLDISDDGDNGPLTDFDPIVLRK